jgi:HSP20 family molecular chaperone IbpA
MTQDPTTTPLAEKPAAAPQTRFTVTPRYRVEENADAYVITADVPGAAATDVETIVDGEKLVVNARRNWIAPEAWTLVHRETARADYRLVLELDRRVNRDAIKAQLTQGVLTLTLPKAGELKPRKIEIAG